LYIPEVGDRIIIIEPFSTGDKKDDVLLQKDDIFVVGDLKKNLIMINTKDNAWPKYKLIHRADFGKIQLAPVTFVCSTHVIMPPG